MSIPVKLEVCLGRQCLKVIAGAGTVAEYSVSGSRKGPGERRDSGCTPRGAHVIAEKIGAGSPAGTVFVGRVPTGEIYSPGLRQTCPDRDWILTRILWLAGTEPGRNQGGEVDTFERYIYIHGAPDDVQMGMPGSGGCIRMRNGDVIELFNRVEVGTPVLITE